MRGRMTNIPDLPVTSAQAPISIRNLVNKVDYN